MCQSVTNLTPARTKVNYFILSRGPFTKKIMDSYDAARQREALFPYTIRTKVCSSKFAYGSVFLWRKLKLTRASVSTVNFRRGALGFSVFGRIWCHLVLEQIIQTFFFVIWAIFNTFVTNRFLIMKGILGRRLKVFPEALSTTEGSFFHVSLPHFDCK